MVQYSGTLKAQVLDMDGVPYLYIEKLIYYISNRILTIEGNNFAVLDLEKLGPNEDWRFSTKNKLFTIKSGQLDPIRVLYTQSKHAHIAERFYDPYNGFPKST